jgi:hypothetical protein
MLGNVYSIAQDRNINGKPILSGDGHEHAIERLSIRNAGVRCSSHLGGTIFLQDRSSADSGSPWFRRIATLQARTIDAATGG